MQVEYTRSSRTNLLIMEKIRPVCGYHAYKYISVPSLIYFFKPNLYSDLTPRLMPNLKPFSWLMTDQ